MKTCYSGNNFVNEEQSLPGTVYHTNIKGATQQMNYEEDGTATVLPNRITMAKYN
jgi:hypothetical protein